MKYFKIMFVAGLVVIAGSVGYYGHSTKNDAEIAPPVTGTTILVAEIAPPVTGSTVSTS